MNVVNILNGATWLFQLAGLGAITSLGHLQTCVTWMQGVLDSMVMTFV